MGLSSKQVSGGWNQSLLQELPKASSATKRQNPESEHDQKQHQQQQIEPLKCPRCDSANTKFCYFNNYNKSQPRHFCKTCKRHWTKGGTLRNVPVGGGRKNKRIKTSHSNSAAAKKSSAVVNTFVEIQQLKDEIQLLPLADQKNMLSMQFCQPSSLLQQNNLDSNGFFLGSSSTLSLPQTQTQDVQFPFSSSSSSSFDTITSSMSTSFQSPTMYNYAEETMEDPTISSIIMPTTNSTTVSLPWQIPITTSGIGMDMSNYWNWDDIDAFVSTDLNMPWDDSENKP